MAISGPSSYISTINEFISHWELANANLGVGNEVILAGGKGVNDLKSLRTSLHTQRSAVEDALNSQVIASSTTKQHKAALIDRFHQFAANVRALYEGSPFESALPHQPRATDAESKFSIPLVDALNLWQRINTSGTVITLPGAYDEGNFADDIDDLHIEYITWAKAGSDLKIARGQRNALQDEIYPMLKQYRQIIPGRFAAGSVYIETLPRLSPLPGATPKAVNASAVWDAAETKARLTWDASSNNKLKEYEVRYTPGTHYDEDDEIVVVNILPNAPRELLTDAGLTQPGASSSYKVYVILTTGNQKGSDTMVVTRPLAG